MGLYLGSNKVSSGFTGGNKGIIDEYSQAEIKTNKVWIDGRPIYRKVTTFTINAQSTTHKEFDLGVPSTATIFDIDIQVVGTGAMFDFAWFDKSILDMYAYRGTTNWLLAFKPNSADVVGGTFYAIMEYTKAEDAIGSGLSKINLPRKLDNYSTEEQIIGTWVNGKPIYRTVVRTGACSLSTTATFFNTNIKDAEELININLKCKYTENGYEIWYDFWKTIETYFNAKTGQIGIMTSAAANFSDSFTILEYTKKTD